MIQWMPFELHTHTNHSDGTHTLIELASNAKNLGFAGIALTDHSTMAGFVECGKAVSATGIHIIRGMEWTTFYGHVLILKIDEYVDWRDLGPSDLHKGIKAVHNQNGIVGVAHPFRVGSPMCTGCYWNYEVNDWSDIDYIEVWSGVFPSLSDFNLRAFQLWTELLNQGYRITAVSGRDWHGSKPEGEPLAATYLAIPEEGSDVECKAVDALKTGAVSVSMGPLLLMYISSANSEKVYGIGETVPLGKKHEKYEIKISMDKTLSVNHWKSEEQPMKIVLNSNLGYLVEFAMLDGDTNATYILEPCGLSWIRTELYGTFQGIEVMIAFTNPMYFGSDKNIV